MHVWKNGPRHGSDSAARGRDTRSAWKRSGIAPWGAHDDVTQRLILIVDDDEALLELLTRGLEILQPSVTAYTARSVDEAIALLAARPFDLVVTDLLMPGVDGFELLAHLSRSARRIPVIVMSGHLTPERRERVISLGGLWCFDKPIHFQEFADAIGALLVSGPDSVVHGVSVAGFLQLLEIEKKTCTMTVRQGDTVGRLFLHRGRLVDAECGTLRGVEAAQRLVGLPEARLDLTNVLASNQRTIDQPMGTLLLDAFRLADEARQALRGEACGAEPSEAGPDLVAVSSELETLTAITGFVAAALYSPHVGMLARMGGSATVDSELCAVVNVSTEGLGGLLAERDWGAVKDADFLTSGGWLICQRAVPNRGGICLVTVFCNASSIGLLQLRLREIVARLQYLCPQAR